MPQEDLHHHKLAQAVEEIVSWSRSWLPDASAVATLVKQYNHIFGTPESPETRREHGLFWQGVCNVVDKTQELARAECGLLDEQKLALLCLGSNEIDFWINKPSWKLIQGSIPGLLVMGEEEAKATLWTQHMVLQGIHRHQNPLAFLVPSHFVISSGLYARRQFQQTKQTHPLTYSASLALLFWQDNEEYLWNAGEKIAKSAERMIPESIRPQNVGKRDPLACLSIEVLLKDFGKYSPEEILERALGRRFDHIPKAVFHDVIDSEKTKRAMFERAISRGQSLEYHENEIGNLGEGRIEREPEPEREPETARPKTHDRKTYPDNDEEEEMNVHQSWLENLPSPDGQNPENSLIQNDLWVRFRENHPDEAGLLERISKGELPVDIAHELKLSKSRISQRVAKARQRLNAFFFKD